MHVQRLLHKWGMGQGKWSRAPCRKTRATNGCIFLTEYQEDDSDNAQQSSPMYLTHDRADIGYWSKVLVQVMSCLQRCCGQPPYRFEMLAAAPSARVFAQLSLERPFSLHRPLAPRRAMRPSESLLQEDGSSGQSPPCTLE